MMRTIMHFYKNRLTCLAHVWLFMLAAMFPAGVRAAERGDSVLLQHDVSVGVGAPGLYPLVGLGDFSNGSGDPYYNDVWSDERLMPAVYAQYLYAINRHVGVGLMTGYTSTTEEYSERNYDMYIYNPHIQGYIPYDPWRSYSREDGFGEPVRRLTGYSDGRKRKSYFALNLVFRAYWFNRRNVAMYSKVGLGLMMTFKKTTASSLHHPDASTMHETTVFLDGNLVPIGIEAGSRQFRGFVELSVGGAYICSAGLKYMF